MHNKYLVDNSCSNTILGLKTVYSFKSLLYTVTLCRVVQFEIRKLMFSEISKEYRFFTES